MEAGGAPVTFIQVLNPEELTVAIRSASLEPCQLSRSPIPSRLGRITGSTVCLDFAEIGPAMLFTGIMPVDCYTLVFVTKCPRMAHSFNFAVDHVDGYLGFFPPGGQLDAHTPEGYANATLTVPVAHFHAAVEQLFPEIPAKVLQQGASMRVGAAEQARLRPLLSAAMESINDPTAPLTLEQPRANLEIQLLEAFVITLREGLKDPMASPGKRQAGKQRHLREARDMIQANSHKALRIEDLALALGMSARGVEALFQESLGIGPNAFIRHQRLHGVRRDLLAADPDTSLVKEMALNWGFWHLGHFSRNYRDLFGERPTDTLRRR